MRYTVKTGSYGSYFYDEQFKRPIPLAEVSDLLNSNPFKVLPKNPSVKKEVTQETLFKAMRRKGITQKALAEFLKCSHQRISEFYVNKPNASKWQPGELTRAYRWVLRQ